MFYNVFIGRSSCCETPVGTSGRVFGLGLGRHLLFSGFKSPMLALTSGSPLYIFHRVCYVRNHCLTQLVVICGFSRMVFVYIVVEAAVSYGCDHVAGTKVNPYRRGRGLHVVDYVILYLHFDAPLASGRPHVVWT